MGPHLCHVTRNSINLRNFIGPLSWTSVDLIWLISCLIKLFNSGPAEWPDMLSKDTCSSESTKSPNIERTKHISEERAPTPGIIIGRRAVSRRRYVSNAYSTVCRRKEVDMVNNDTWNGV